jgi:hypothetical protein
VPPILPSAQAACDRTRGDESSSAFASAPDRGPVAAIAERDADVAQETVASGAAHRASLKARFERRPVEIEKLGEIALKARPHRCESAAQ